MKPYTEEQVQEKLKEYEGWEYDDNAIHTAFEFENLVNENTVSKFANWISEFLYLMPA